MLRRKNVANLQSKLWKNCEKIASEING